MVLAAVFLVAAVGKLLDRERSVAAFAAIRAPGALVKPALIALPAAELLVALGLVVASTAQAGAIGALVLLATFTSAMVVSVRRGDDFECKCFGSLHSERVGGTAILRNAALAATAAAIASQGVQPAIDARVAHRSASSLLVLSLSAAVVVAAGVVALARQRDGVRLKPSSTPTPRKPRAVGGRAPAIRLEDLTGMRITLKSLLSDSSPIALLFLSRERGSCRAMLSDLSRWQMPLSRDLPIHVISSAGPDETRAMADEYGLDRVLIDRRGAVSNRYRIRHTPAAVIVGPDGRLASSPANGQAAIEALIRRVLGERSATRAPLATTIVHVRAEHSGLGPIKGDAGLMPSSMANGLRAAQVLGAMARTDLAGALVRGEFERVGIEHVVIKGRAFASRLYRQAAERPYTDTDVVIRVGDRERAEQVLERLGYWRVDRDGDLLGAPGYSHTFVRGDGVVIDLHWNLSGVSAPPELTWALLVEHTRELSIGGQLARVPDDGATALIVVLHNAHHGARWRTTKPDLDRAAAVLGLDAWRWAQALAGRLGAEEAFAAGLALSESGREVARRLDANASVSLEYRLRADAVSYRAWALHRIATARGARTRARVIADVIVPPPAVMRQFFPLARRGALGLTLSYLVRPGRLAAGALPSLAEYLRARNG